MDAINIIIGVAATILGAVLSYAAFFRNSKNDSKAEGKADGTILTEIGYIKSGVDRIERRQEKQEEQYVNMAERVVKLEGDNARTKKRLELLEEHEREAGR